MAPILETWSDPGGYFCYLKPLLIYFRKYSMYDMFTHESEGGHAGVVLGIPVWGPVGWPWFLGGTTESGQLKASSLLI